MQVQSCSSILISIFTCFLKVPRLEKQKNWSLHYYCDLMTWILRLFRCQKLKSVLQMYMQDYKTYRTGWATPFWSCLVDSAVIFIFTSYLVHSKTTFYSHDMILVSFLPKVLNSSFCSDGNGRASSDFFQFIKLHKLFYTGVRSINLIMHCSAC